MKTRMTGRERWTERLNKIKADPNSSPFFCKADFISLRKNIGDRDAPFGERTALLQLVNEVACMMPDGISPMRIDTAQSKAGKLWTGSVLKRVKSKKKNRTAKDDQMQEILELAQSQMFREFRFGGLLNTTTTTLDVRYGIIKVIPIWQVISCNRRLRSYAYGSWQSELGYIPDPGFEL